MKSSPSISHLLHNVKSRVKISSILVAFLENMNFSKSTIVYPIEPKKESSTDAIPLVMRVLKLVKKISDMIFAKV